MDDGGKRKGNETNKKKNIEGCLGVVGQWCLFQLQNDWSHSTHVAAWFTRFWIEVTQLCDAFPFGAGLNVGRFSYELFLCISVRSHYKMKWERKSIRQLFWNKNDKNYEELIKEKMSREFSNFQKTNQLQRK